MQPRFRTILILAVAGVLLLPLLAFASPALTAAGYGKNEVISHVAVVPEPGTLTLLGTGLLGLAGIVRRRFRRTA